MDEQDIFGAAAKAFRRILDADIVAGDFAEKAGLEEHLKSTRKVAEKFEILLHTTETKGVFNLFMCYAYKPFMKIPGIARTCKEQTEYFLERAKSYGVKIPEEKNSTDIKKQITGD